MVPHPLKKIKHSIKYLVSFVLQGIYQDMNTTALIDLTELADCNVEQFSRAIVAGSVGTMLGAIIGGFIADVIARK